MIQSILKLLKVYFGFFNFLLETLYERLQKPERCYLFGQIMAEDENLMTARYFSRPLGHDKKRDETD